MPNKDIKTEPRFMTMIQKDLLPTCKALNLDVDPFANARTVFIDRDSVGRILSYMSDHEINPEWYGSCLIICSSEPDCRYSPASKANTSHV